MIVSALERAIAGYRAWRTRSAPGVLGAFYRAGGNALLYENLPVRSSDRVLDVGGYRGDWTAEMCARYGCRSIVLEPIPEFAAKIRERFEHNDRVVALGVGLGATDATVEMALAADGSSVVRRPDKAQRVRATIEGVGPFFERHGLDEVACLKVNIEGAEYDLLGEMIHRNLLGRVRCLVCQFHDIGPTTAQRRAAIREALERTHECRFNFDLVWERWDRRSAARSP